MSNKKRISVSLNLPIVAWQGVIQVLERSYDLSNVVEVSFESYWNVNLQGEKQNVVKLFAGRMGVTSPPLAVCLEEGEKYVVVWLSPFSSMPGEAMEGVWASPAITR